MTSSRPSASAGDPAASASAEELLAVLEAGRGEELCTAPSDCAGVRLPAWAAQVVQALFEAQGDAARDWAHRLYGPLARLGGRVPFDVVHDWHAEVVLPMLSEARSGRDGSAQREIRRLHLRALAGSVIDEAVWEAHLTVMLKELYEDAYESAEAYETAWANARAYALFNGFATAEADDYGRSYAQLSTEANARAFAEANATANARATAGAYAAGDADRYAAAYPAAQVRAYAQACAVGADGEPERGELRKAAFCRLADGLVESLVRAAARPAART